VQAGNVQKPVSVPVSEPDVSEFSTRRHVEVTDPDELVLALTNANCPLTDFHICTFGEEAFRPLRLNAIQGLDSISN